MKRVAVAAVLATLAVPASALAAGRAVTYNARVVRADALNLVLRRLDGRTVRFSAAQIAGLPGATADSGHPAAPLAHMAGGPRSAGSGVAQLAPGIVVRVTETVDGSGRAAVRLGVPPGVSASRRARGVVSAVSAGSVLLDTAGGVELRLRGAVGGLHPCQQASVVYHQEKLTLVADRVLAGGPADCAR